MMILYILYMIFAPSRHTFHFFLFISLGWPSLQGGISPPPEKLSQGNSPPPQFYAHVKKSIFFYLLTIHEISCLIRRHFILFMINIFNSYNLIPGNDIHLTNNEYSRFSKLVRAGALLEGALGARAPSCISHFCLG